MASAAAAVRNAYSVHRNLTSSEECTSVSRS